MESIDNQKGMDICIDQKYELPTTHANIKYQRSQLEGYMRDICPVTKALMLRRVRHVQMNDYKNPIIILQWIPR